MPYLMCKGFYSKEQRDSKRKMLDDESFGNYLFENGKLFMSEAYGGCVFVGVNEKLRFLKYDHPKAEFKKHYDGIFSRGNSETSMITMQIYLNDKMSGGCTTFFNSRAWKSVSILMISTN